MNVFFLTLFQGYTHPREYIVTEWPLPTTCSDIWSLVYDHDCSAVVVLCNPTSTVSNVSRLSHDVSSMYSFQDSGEKKFSISHKSCIRNLYLFALVVYIDYRAKKLHYGFVGIRSTCEIYSQCGAGQHTHYFISFPLVLWKNSHFFLLPISLVVCLSTFKYLRNVEPKMPEPEKA